MHRLMITSAAYRQASTIRADAALVDRENRLLWRQNSRRLEAEAIRDAMLAAAGTLDAKMYGEPTGEEERPTGEIVASGEDKTGRRSIYLLVRRSMPVTLLNVFDAPVMETNCTRRVTSTTSAQALALMNGSFISSQAVHFGRRVQSEASVTGSGGAAAIVNHANRLATDGPYGSATFVEATIDRAYRLALSRNPTAQEQAAAQEFLRQQIARYEKTGKTHDQSSEQAYADICQALLSSNEFVYVD